MTVDAQHYPLERLVSTFADWLKHRRELNELRELDRVEIDRIASDLHVSLGELDQLVQKGPHAADELPKLLQALGIDETALANTHPQVLRDMERVCSLCQHKRQCDHDVLEGTAAEHYESYCPNAPTIGQLNRTAVGP